MFRSIGNEISAVFGRDPAVRSRLEVALCYPGFHAILFYRTSNWLWRKDLKLLGRFVSHLGRFFSGIEIHPGATIGKQFFIDHGMGVVIGETAEVGNHVTLYHGVTLGGTTWNKGKRHPTLGDNVVVGAGAKILGPVTVGDGAAVGSNAVVVKDVPPGATVVGIPARVVDRGATKLTDDEHFAAYGATTPDMPDPVSKAINGLLEHIAKLDARIAELETDDDKSSSTTQVAEPAVDPADKRADC
ncbi:MAG: serine O-acetyltransferase [Rhodospirillaceae bacterium]|nr:serine O-acetyltransferase [Rhodospirillaceae bacterium]|tara:strand:+ start:13414 stop:14145 length:732 start_codon:yes stop_codon:yes gene_type:complete